LKILILHYISDSKNKINAQKIHLDSLLNVLKKKSAFIIVHNASFNGKKRILTNKIKNKKGIFQILKGYGFKTLILNFVDIKKDILTIKKHRPDVVLIWFQNLKFSPFLACKILCVPCVAFLNSPIAYLNRHFFSNRYPPGLPEKVEKICCKLSKSVVTISEISKAMLSKYGISPDKIFVSPDGVDIKMFRPTNENTELRSILHWDNCFVYGFVGAFRAWHNPSELVWVIKEISKLRSMARFLLVGDGPYKNYVENNLKKEISTGKVFMSGIVSWKQVPNYLQTMDAFLAPFIKYDYFFPSPLKIVESMAVGIPVLTTAQGELSQLIKDGKNGFLYECGNKKSLLKKALQMIDNPKKCKKMGKLARKTVEKERSWDKVVLPLWQSLYLAAKRG